MKPAFSNFLVELPEAAQFCFMPPHALRGAWFFGPTKYRTFYAVKLKTRNKVKTTAFAFAIWGLLLTVSPAYSHGDGGWFGGFGGGGEVGFGFGGGHRDFGGFGGFGGDFGLGFYDAESAQTRFESQFDSLKTKYDDGVAGSTDFFTTTQYDNIVSKTERLDDRYGLFVSSVTRSITRISDLISTTNDDITYFNDLLANYQADTSLSATRLDRIEAWINRITDRLTNRVTSLTDKQTTLQTNLPTYQAFQMNIDSFLSDIQAAGSGTSSGLTSSAVSLTSRSMLVKGSLSSDVVTCASSGTSLTPTAAPEPATATLVVLAIGAGSTLGARRSRRRM